MAPLKAAFTLPGPQAGVLKQVRVPVTKRERVVLKVAPVPMAIASMRARIKVMLCIFLFGSWHSR